MLTRHVGTLQGRRLVSRQRRELGQASGRVRAQPVMAVLAFSLTAADGETPPLAPPGGTGGDGGLRRADGEGQRRPAAGERAEQRVSAVMQKSLVRVIENSLVVALLTRRHDDERTESKL